ncbi:Hsp70 family protein [Paenibacillus odorifer]|uniref:Hsp70 family protein n=1 Tax=Paenibacillus odorifer TaxID=189426 RepID=UPI00096E875C|nr:Hsp70 family protein [Paenibacillus odorifer]OME19922.1 hypothetical protein BSK57_23425 [Paenibacillus odorifer]
MSRFVGIDLGTTNSTVSVAHKTIRNEIETTTLEVTQTDERGDSLIQNILLPSVLYIDPQNTPYVGRFAKKMGGVFPSSVVKEAKRVIGQDKGWTINDVRIRPEEVSSFVLSTLRAQVKDYYPNEEIDSVVITIPANFDFQQQNATKTAAKLSGFREEGIHMIPEPTAALIDFLNEEEKLAPTDRRIDFTSGKKNLMVFDLGGGTCDVSILQVSGQEGGRLDIQEISISQYTDLGGMDFDTEIMKELLRRVVKESGLSAKAIAQKFGGEVAIQLLANLTDIAENAKMRFSTSIESKLRTEGMDYFENKDQFDNISFSAALPGTLPSELVTTFKLTKKDYDNIISKLLFADGNQLKNIETPIRSALANTILGPMQLEEIDAVFLVGGMTYYQTIQERIYDIFNRRIKPLKSSNPMASVSRGAAVYHYRINQISLKGNKEYVSEGIDLKNRQNVIGNTVPNNIYVDIVGGDPVPILEKGTKLPFERIIQDKFIVNGPKDIKTVNGMQLELFSAPFAKSIHVKKLKSATIEFKTPVEINSKLVLKVSCNIEREVAVKAWLESDETEVIDVNIGSHEFTEEEIRELQERQATLNKNIRQREMKADVTI